MDAEIWSYADTRNGRLILFVLSLLIVIKEIAVAILPQLGLPALNPTLSPFAVSAPFAALREPILLALILVLVLCLNLGFSWARRALGLVYLLTAADSIGAALQFPLTGTGPMLTLANGVLGLLIALTLLFSAQLKAYFWRRAAGRLIIPIPPEDDPFERRDRRTHTLGEHALIALQRTVSLLLVIGVLLAIAHLYGVTGPILHAFGR